MGIEWSLPPERQGHQAPESLAERRAASIAVLARQSISPGINVVTSNIGGVPCVVAEPSSPSAEIVYFHGGGYRIGTAGAWAPFASRLAATINARVFVPDYRLAPEHPFPAAIVDATRAYEAVVQRRSGGIFVGGDSAGGGLALALCVACLGVNAPIPRGLLLLSPWVDLTVSLPTYDSNSTRDLFFSREFAKVAAEQYLQGHSAEDPLASPLKASLAGMPPAAIFVGTEEVLLDDSIELAKSLGRFGATSDLHVVEGMQHVWPLVFHDLPETVQALAEMRRFVETHRENAGARDSTKLS